MDKDIMKTIGVVILNYNDAAETMRLVNQIKDFKAITNIVIVDNCSTDDSVIRLRNLKNDNIVVIENNNNKGYAAGNNIGIKYLLNNVDVDIVCISNPDVIFDENFINEICYDFENSNYKVLTGVQFTKEKNEYYNGSWECNRRHYIDLLNDSFVLARLFKSRKNKDKNHVSEQSAIVKVGCISGCLMFLDADIMYEISGFDEKTFLYFEEDILCKRICQAGYEIGVDSRLSFIHKGAHSINGSVGTFYKVKIFYSSLEYCYNTYWAINSIDRLIFSIKIKVLLVEKRMITFIRGVKNRKNNSVVSMI